MGAAQSAFNPDRSPQVAIPSGYRTPSFPSLYVPNFDITQRQLGVFLYDAAAIWRFTLYWTLLLVCGIYLICALVATANLFLSATLFRPMPKDRIASDLVPPTPLTSIVSPAPRSRARHDPSQPVEPNQAQGQDRQDDGQQQHQHTGQMPKLRRRRPTRPPLWPLLLIPVGAVIVAGLVALVSATVIGFALAAVYSAGGFSMSTWVPLLWAIIIALILIISSYSTLTSIL